MHHTGNGQISLFAPHFCALDTLEKHLTRSRREVADELLSKLASSVKKKQKPAYELLVGTEGRGKTHVLAYVAKSLLAQYDVDDLTVVALFDDNREIASLFDFLVACLRQANHFTDEEILERIEAFAGEPLAAATELFDEMTVGTHTVLIVEHFNQFLSSLDKSGPRELRKFLDARPAVSLIASSNAPLPAQAKAKHPFKSLLQEEILPPMPVGEAQEFVRTILGSPADTTQWLPMGANGEAAGTFAAFHQLCGGNHRLLAMLAAFLETGVIDDAVSDFVKMVHYTLTPYYQQAVERLSNQQLKILLAILRHNGRALTVKEIARWVFLPSQTVSRQLYDLLHEDYVTRTQMGRESYYEIRSPLLRAVLDITHGTHVDLHAAVEFLTRWHQCAHLSGYGIGGDDLAGEDPETVMSAYAAARDRDDTDPVTLARAGVDAAAVLGEIGRHDDALEVASELLNTLGGSEVVDVQIHIAQALLNQGADFTALQRLGRAITTFREVVTRFDDSEDSRFTEFVLRARLHIAECHLNRGENLEALEELDRAAALRPTDAAVQGQRVQLLFELRRDGDAFKIISDRLLDEQAGWAEHAAFARNLVYLFDDNERLLTRVAGIYNDHQGHLAAGLILWCQEHLPVPAADVGAVENAAEVFRTALGATAGCDRALAILNVACRRAAGDTRAPLGLPAELRYLL